MIPSQIPYLIDCALARIECGESLDAACAWIWDRHSTRAEREAVDAWLVATQHPMAQEAGLPRHRFRQLVREHLQ